MMRTQIWLIIGSEEMAQSVKRLLCNYEVPNSNPQNPHKNCGHDGMSQYRKLQTGSVPSMPSLVVNLRPGRNLTSGDKEGLGR